MQPSAYGPVFWLTYVANTSLMVAVSALFRYSDFVRLHGGGDSDLAWIVGIGTVGALLMRIVQGVGIDRFGPRLVWLLSLGLFVASMFAHLAVTDAHGVSVYIVRIMMTTALAGAFGASITFVSLRAPEHRMAEMIGMLGSSGFVGMALGPALGDYLAGPPPADYNSVWRMFVTAISAGVVSFISAAMATTGQLARKPRRTPPMWKVIRRYHPGPILAVGAVMGLGITLPMVFVRPFSQSLGIEGIMIFFLTYAVTAFTVRICTRRLPEQIGVRPVIYMGVGALVLSMLSYLAVTNETWLILPGFVGGVAHAFLFPSVVAGGSAAFPARYRGLATTLMLAMFDLGSLIGQPIIGGLLDTARSLNWPPYPTMFISVAIGVGATGVAYACLQDRR